MLLPIFLMLNLQDQNYYNHDNIVTADILMQTSELEESETCILGPKTLDASKHSNLPLFIVSRTNTYDDYLVHPTSHGHIIISSVKTGAIQIEPLESMPEGKTAMPEEPQEPRPKVTDKKFAFTDSWIDLPYGKKTPLADGEFVFAVTWGENISNKHSLEVINKEINYDAIKKLAPEPIIKPVPPQFSKNDLSPKIPADYAIDVSIQKGTEQYTLSGSFLLPKRDPNFAHRPLPIHLVFRSNTFESVQVLSVSVPLSTTKNSDKGIEGYFNKNISELLNTLFGSPENYPQSAYITAIHGAVFSETSSIELKPK